MLAPLPGYWPSLQWVHYTTSCNTQSSAPEDGQNNCPKHVELIGIINKLLLLYVVGCLYYLYGNEPSYFIKCVELLKVAEELLASQEGLC